MYAVRSFDQLIQRLSNSGLRFIPQFQTFIAISEIDQSEFAFSLAEFICFCCFSHSRYFVSLREISSAYRIICQPDYITFDPALFDHLCDILVV